MSETTSNAGGDNVSLGNPQPINEDNRADFSGDSTSLSEFPPVEERSGPEGAEEDCPDSSQRRDDVTTEDEDSLHERDVVEHEREDEDEDDEEYDSVPPTIDRLTSSQMLPWGAPKERTRFPSTVNIETDIRPGEFVMRTLFAEFTVQTEKKINAVMSEPLERALSKSLQRGEDPQFDQLLSSFGSVAEHCLPSLLKTLFAWYDRQGVEWIVSDYKGKGDSKGKSELSYARSELEFMSEKRDLAVEFIFCLVLIEVLRQLSVHPGHEDLVQHIENLAFKHFRYRDSQILGPNAANIHIIADLYAEVLGVLAQSRFLSTKKKFFAELRELRSREASTHMTQSIISLLMGMKFFRVKMVPFEDFEHSFQFMNELAQYFLEVKDKDIKHAVAGLFVEILVPVAAAVKNEVNVPCLKNFVEKLYSQTLDMCTRSKHRLAIFPLVTCLLCVSQKAFFLHNWHYFLTMCLQHLKNRDTKMARVALESLYRLLWVYMIRIKCESNNVTQSRLQSIVNSLFPKGSKAVVPRDTPLNIFVKIIQFIAQEKLDFSMREIVFDLLSVGRPIKVINAPERMSIGLRAFLVVADSLQQKEGEPPMPRTVGVMPSGSTLRVKKTFLNKMLTEDTAKTIGLSHYYPYVRKVFDDILRALDVQFGKPYLLTNAQNANKEADDAKPKLDLFRTVIAAIPRLIPDGMGRGELVDTLSRLTVHNDEELRGLAYNSLQNLVIDFPDWREDVLYGFMQFVVKEVSDQQITLLDNALRVVYQLLNAWRNAVDKIAAKSHDLTRHDPNRPDLATTLHMAEGFAMVMLCHIRLAPRRLAVHILKEVKQLFKLLGALREDSTVLDALDKTTQEVAESCSHLMPIQDKATVMASSSTEFQWLADRNSSQWTAGFNDEGVAKSGSTQHLFNSDPWSACLLAFLHPDRLPKMCPSAMHHSWPTVHVRLAQLFTVVDPAPVTDNRASLLRPGTAPKKILNEKDISMHLWKNYTAFACRVVPPIPNPVIRCVSPDLMLSSSPESLGIMDRSLENKSPSPMVSPTVLYKLLVPLLRCEVSDMRDSVVHALGRINHTAIMDLMSELVIYIREAIDRKQENMRRRRRRDALRLQLVRVLKIMAEEKTFSRATSVIDQDSGGLAQTFTEYIDGARLYLEADSADSLKENVPGVKEIKIHFAQFLRLLIDSFTLERRRNLLKKDLRRNLFYLFAGWSGRFGLPFSHSRSTLDRSTPSEFEFSALQAMVSVLCCGPCFDDAITEDDTLYNFLDSLLEYDDPKVYNLAQTTIVLLLEFNPDISTLLDWVVDRCFTGNDKVADGCFLALATIFATREYPCDHYTAIINVTLLNTGCPRSNIHETALQLLQILDKRFFGSESFGQDRERSTLDVLLSTTYSRSQLYLSRQLAQLHPELTMPMFSEICHRLQTARPSVIKCLLYYMLPWLYNLELVDPNVSPECSDVKVDSQQGRGREGWGSSEATEMITNNLFYITVKFGNEHPKEVEELWSAMVACWPKNLRIIIRYLLIVSGMAPNELIEYAKRVVLYLGRAQPVKTLDELMMELQTVETLNCMIERTETPPFYRLTSLRKTSSNSESNAHLNASRQDLSTEKGTIHTKRHSQEDPQKENTSKTELTLSGSLRSAGSMASSAGSAMVAGIQRVGEKVRALSGSTALMKHDVSLPSNDDPMAPMTQLENPHHNQTNEREFNVHPPAITTSALAASTSFALHTSMNTSATLNNSAAMAMSMVGPSSEQHLHPLPMPEYGGWFAPLTEFLPEPSQPISNFHRCNLAVVLLTDLVVDGLDLDCHSVDWSVHVPMMLHIIFLGLDNSREIVHRHCQQLLLNLLIVLGHHNDHLSISRILMNSKTDQMNFGLLLPTLPILHHNFTEKTEELDSFFHRNSETLSLKDQSGTISEDDEAVQMKQPSIMTTDADGERILNPLSPDTDVTDVTKALINFISSRKCQPLWQYEDINRNLWSIRSAEQIDVFLQHVLRVFEMSLPHSHLAERWSQLSLVLALSCSSRHYAGRSLQIFRALRVPITSRNLSDVLSRLVETIAEQGEDMQGYVTELFLTLEAVVDALDSDFRPMDMSRDIFKSTPNLKDMTSPSSRRNSPNNVPFDQYRSNNVATSPGGATNAASPIGHVYHASAPPSGLYSKYYDRSHSYHHPIGATAAQQPISFQPKSVSPICDMRGRSSTETDNTRQRPVHQSSTSSLSRSRSAQSLKIQDQTTQDDKMNILVQLFWICLAVFESDFEHEFLLALRLLDKVLNKLPLDRPDVRERVEKLYHQLKWPHFPGVHSLLLKGCTNANTYEATIQALSRFTLLLDFTVVDPTQSLAFPMNVMALLPYMVQNYEDANELCIISAENIAQVSTEKNKKLENLATVMTLYSRRTFSKESFQWTKCVVKYLYDLYSNYSLSMLSFLVEVLEKGPSSIQSPVLTIIHCLLHYVDMATSTQTINADLLRTVAKFIESSHWKEALKILKLAVSKSSTLVAPLTSTGISYHWETASGSNFAETDMYFKKELPGRTMEFTFDLSQTPVIGRRQRPASGSGGQSYAHYAPSLSSSTYTPSMSSSAYGGSYSIASTATLTSAMAPAASTNNVSLGASRDLKDLKDSLLTRSLGGGSGIVSGSVRDVGEGAPQSTLSPRRSFSITAADASVSSSTSGWKRPWMSQSTVRERLVNLLNTCGQRVGLPKSPSVIFSQTSENLERQSSMASSTEEVSGTNDVSTDSKQHDTTDTEQKFGMYMREFDFLEYELESLEGESMDNFNWGVRRPSLSHLDGGSLGAGSGLDVDLSSAQESFNDVTPVLPKRETNAGVGAEESSDDEMGSITQMSGRSGDDHSGASSSVSTTSSGLYPPNTLPLDALGKRRSCNTPPSETESGSECSDEEGDTSDHDLTPCNPSPSLSQLMGWGNQGQETMPEQEDGIEESWKLHVQVVLVEPNTKNLLGTFVAFGKLYDDLKVKTGVLTQDSVVQISKTNLNPDHVGAAINHLQNLTDILSEDYRYPFVWCNLTSLGDGKLTERAKFNVLEIQENFENYGEKKERTVECLDAIKAHQKLVSLGEQMGNCSIDTEQVDLCRWLYKLHFQLLMLLDSYTKLLKLVLQCPRQGMIDKSAEVTQLQIDLIQAFKFQHPLPVEQDSVLINSRRDGSPIYNSTQPEITEEQTVTIPGEEDLPARTPTPELLELDPTVESGGGDLQTIQIDDYEENLDPNSSLHQESIVDHDQPPAVEQSEEKEEAAAATSEVEPELQLESESNPEMTDSLVEDSGDHDRSTETITPLEVEEQVELETEVAPEVKVQPREKEIDCLTTLDDAERLIVRFLLESKYFEAIQTYRRLKTRWPNVVSEVIVGVPTVADDIWAMLNMYCNELSGRRLSDSSSFFAMTVSDSELTKHCSRLTAACMQLFAAVKLMEAPILKSHKSSPSGGDLQYHRSQSGGNTDLGPI